MTSQTMVLYLLKSILISCLFISYYFIALRDKKFHYYNRFYLLSTSIISLVAPLLKFELFSVPEPVLFGSNEYMQLVLPSTNSNDNIQIDWANYTLLATGIVTIILLTFLLINVIRIHLLKKKYDVTKMEGFDFINTEEENAPFSFLNNLFWKQSISLQDEGGQQIFKHEITHIQQKHTWDRIYCQVIASIFWMNPFNWIIQRELIAIHEFIADEEAVGNSNVEAFAKMLLQAHYGNHFFNPTHNFFYSTIKRRLFMLNQTKNTKYSYLRKVMVLPILFSTVCIVSVKVHANEKIKLGVVQTKNNISLLVSDTTKPKTGVKNSQELKPAYFLDGVKISEAEMNSISTSDIESVNVLKGEQAIQKYPEDGKNGVVLIVRKGIKIQPQSKLDDVNSNTNSNPESNVTTETPVNVENGPVFTVTQKPAMFPGGAEAWSKYLLNNLDRDLPKRNHAVPGKYFVKLNFVINKNGDVENVIAENNPGYGTASEAIRVIEKGPKWIPAEQNGKKVIYLMKQIIQFNVADN